MKRTLLRTIALCMTGSLLTGSLMARQAYPSSPGSASDPGSSSSSSSSAQPPSSSSSSSGMLSPTGAASSQKPERLSQVMGATVKSSSGETLGQINDFVVNPASGRIQFAIISLSDQSGKMTAVPWSLVKPGSDPSTFTLNADKQKLSSAQTFDATSWPDFSQQDWSQKIYSYYGVQPPSRMGGHIPTGGSESGEGSSGIQPGGSPGSSGSGSSSGAGSSTPGSPSSPGSPGSSSPGSPDQSAPK
ncbi:MAG: photosystem reaction center subunit [Pedosphaera sp.]|nr:photosystem reaction center subunit [Pedosphaera sp.]